MDTQTTSQILNELIPTFQALDTQTTAVLQFLKDKNYASDEQLAPYLKQADDTCSVRWLAIRLRLERLLAVPEDSGAAQTHEQDSGAAKVDAAKTGSAAAADKAAERTYEEEVADNLQKIERKDEGNGQKNVA
jgi:hypothetical protein